MKKIVCLSLILLITVCLTSSVFAASCKIDLKPHSRCYSKRYRCRKRYNSINGNNGVW